MTRAALSEIEAAHMLGCATLSEARRVLRGIEPLPGAPRRYSLRAIQEALGEMQGGTDVDAAEARLLRAAEAAAGAPLRGGAAHPHG